MAIVVSDTSPIVALAYLEKLQFLQNIFGEVLVPPAVVAELHKPEWRVIADDALTAKFLLIRAASNRDRVLEFEKTLDPGESEALALAIEVHADAVLIDEIEGRETAEKCGLRTIGVLGILLAAKNKSLIETIGPELDRLKTGLGFHLSERLRLDVLRQAGEADD